MEKVIFIGKTGCGKTTLCQKLNELQVKYKKTQAVEIYDNAIDTPGEYLENRNYYSALIMSSIDACVIALVADVTEEECYFPPQFAMTFTKPVIGVLTKMSLAPNEEHVAYLEKRLMEAGVSQIFKIDTLTEYNLHSLKMYLDQFIDL